MRVTRSMLENNRIKSSMKIAALITFIVAALLVGQGSLAEIDTWERSDFVPATGTTVTGLSEAGMIRLAGDSELGIPEGITAIGNHAFQDLGLTAIELPATLQSIGTYAFTSNQITSVNLEDTQLAFISTNAFRDNRLTSVSLPETCVEVRDNAFVNNEILSLTANHVSIIGSKAFANNRLTTVTLPAVISVAPSAFDTNGRVVAISAPVPLDSHFSNGSGFIFNPVTIRVNYLNTAGVAFRAPQVLGDDFTSNNLYPSGVTYTVNAPILAGWQVIEPVSYTEILSEGASFDFTYRAVVATPVITVSSRFIELGDPAITQEMALSWITATSGVDGSAITDITVTPQNGETFPIATDIERDVQLSYRAVDVYGNVGTRTINVAISPGLLYQNIGKGWQYIDFDYGTGDDSGTVVGLRYDLSGYGFEKHNGTVPFSSPRDIVLPGLNPYTGEPITHIADNFDGASRSVGTVSLDSIDFSKMIDLEVVGANAFSGSTNLTEINLSKNPALSRIERESFSGSGQSVISLKIAPSSADLYIGYRVLGHARALAGLDLSGRTGRIELERQAFYEPRQFTYLNIGPSSSELIFGAGSLYGAQVTELDLSERTGRIVIEGLMEDGGLIDGVWHNLIAPAIGESFLTTFAIGPSDQELIIGDIACYPTITELDLSGRTGRIEIGDGVFYYAPLTSIEFGPSDQELVIGRNTFYDAKITELDLSGRTGRIKFYNYAFGRVPLTSLKIGASDQELIIGDNDSMYGYSGTFQDSKLTELDLSGRTGRIEINGYAFASSPLTNLKIGASNQELHIGTGAFLNTPLVQLDLSGRTGRISVGYDAFSWSPLTTLKIGPSDEELIIRGGAFQSAQLTELDLSGRTGRIEITHPYGENTRGAFHESPLASLKIGPSDQELIIGNCAFWNAQLTELDLSGRTGGIRIGGSMLYDWRMPSSFAHSPLTSFVVGASDKELYIGCGAFTSAQLTELDLSGRTGRIEIDRFVFGDSPIRTFSIGPSNQEFIIGDFAFAKHAGGDWGSVSNALFTELDLSRRTGVISIGANAFRDVGITELKIGASDQGLWIGNTAFQNAQLIELDLSGRTGSVRIGAQAFFNSPLTDFVVGASNRELWIFNSAFQNARLTELDLSGRTGWLEIGPSAFQDSPIADLRIGASTQDLIVGNAAFRDAKLTELDLSGRTGTITIGSIGINDYGETTTVEGAFHNSVITDLKFGTLATDIRGLFIGARSFYSAALDELDLSENAVRTIGYEAFHNSSFDVLIIGRLVGTLSADRNNFYGWINRYGSGGVWGPQETPGSFRIVGHTSELPILLLQNTTNRNMLSRAPGYFLNPLFIEVRHVDGAGNELRPTRTIATQYPYDGVFKSYPIYGYKPDEYEKRLTVGVPATPQILRETVTFTYTPFNPGDLGNFEFTLEQDVVKGYDLVGNTLSTRFNLLTSWPDSQNPFDDKGFAVRLYYDPTHVQYLDHTPPREGGTVFTVHNDAEAGILSFTFPNGTQPGDVGPDIWWRLVPGYTQEDTRYPIYAQYEDGQGRDVYVEAAPVYLAGYYLRPNYSKMAVDFYGMATDVDEGFDNPLAPSMTYNFKMLHPNPYATGHAIARWMEEIVITDELPTYTQLIDSETITDTRASFNPDKNPGWVLLEDGITLQYKKSEAFIGMPAIPRLILDFPYAKPNTRVFNTYSASMAPLNKGEFEGEWTGSAFDSSWFYPDYETQWIPGHVTTAKNPSNYGKDSVQIKWAGSPEAFENRAGWFSASDLTPASEIAWRLNFSGSNLAVGGSYQNFIFRDYGLDERLMYVGVDVSTLGPCFIRAFDESGNALVDIGPLSGRYDFSEDIREDIKSIELYSSSRSIWNSSESVQAYVFTKLIDQTIDSVEHPAILEGGRRFENRFTLSADIVLGDSTQSRYEVNDLAAVYIRGTKATIGINKTQNLPSAIILKGSEKLDYALKLDHFDESNRPTAASYHRTTITNLKIVDVLPTYFEYDEFVPAASFANATTGLSWRTVGDGFTDKDGKKYDIFEITADTFRVGESVQVGTIKGSLSPATPSGATLYNHVYMDADRQDDVLYGGRLTSSQNTLRGIDNPFGLAGIPMYQTDLLVSSTRELIARKYIRGLNTDETWQAWKSTGVITRPGAEFQYRLALFNWTEQPRYDIDIIDVLPAFNDRNITLRDGGVERIPRNSAFDNTLINVEVPDGYKWEYIKSAIPENYGVGTPQSPDLYFDAQSWIHGGDANGVIVGDPADIAQATVIRIIYASKPSPRLDIDEVLEVIITMNAQEDGDTYAGGRAWNSFAFRNTFDIAGNPQARQYQQPNAVYNEISDKPARIELRKRAGTGGSTYLGGAVFELYRKTETGLVFVMRATSSSDTETLGMVVFDGIERDDYIIKEVKAPEGYLLNETEIEVRFGQFSVGNGIADMWIHDAGIFDNEVAPPPPVFGNLIIEKRDANGQLQPGIEFNFFPGGTFGFSRVTDANGRIVLNHIPVGMWFIQEVLPNSSNLIPISFWVTIGETENSELQSINPNIPSITLVEQSGSQTITVHNVLARVSLTKIGVLTDAAWNTPPTEIDPNRFNSLDYIFFDLYKVESNVKGDPGTLVEPWWNYRTYTDWQGKLTYSPITMNQLYYWEEFDNWGSTSGFFDVSMQDPTLDSSRHYFWIDADGKLYNGDPAQGGVLYDYGQVVVKNHPFIREGFLTINKFDWSKNADGVVNRIPLQGVTFIVEQEDPLTGIWSEVARLTTDQDGKIGPERFGSGTYRFYESETPDGYLLDATIRTFTVNTRDSNQQFTYNIDNAAITPKLIKGNLFGTYNPRSSADRRDLNAAYEYLTQVEGLAVHKMVNDVGLIELLVGLGGAEFTIKEFEGLAADGEPINTWTKVVSDTDGTLMVDSLLPPLVFKEGNTYTFQETKAPQGYTLNNRIHTYQPRSEAEAIRANGGKWIGFDNRALQHRIILSKFASDTRRALAGATFELLHPDKTEVYPGRTFTSDSAGLVEFDELIPGVYYLREVAAPDRYVTREGVVYKFTITGGRDYAEPDVQEYEDLFIIDEEITIVEARTSSGDIFWVLYNDPEIPDASLTIEKTVPGNDFGDEFTFIVSTIDDRGQKVPYSLGAYTFIADVDTDGIDRVTDENGALTLFHGQKAIIYGMEKGDVYYIEEIIAEGYRTRIVVTAQDGSSTTYRTNDVEFVITGNDVVSFINTKMFAFPFTGGSGMMMTVILASALAAAAVGASFISNRRNSMKKRTLQLMMLVLATVIMMGLSTSSAFAQQAVQDSIETGSIIVHKYLLDDLAQSGPANDGKAIATLPSGAQPLSGISFRLQQVRAQATGSNAAVLLESEDVRWVTFSGGLDRTGQTNGQGVVTFADLPQGYYVITELASDKVADPALPFLVAIPTVIEGADGDDDEILFEVHVYPKNMNIDINKVLEYDDKTKGKHDSLHIGDIANWLITAGVPSRIADARSFAIYDTYSEGLSFVVGSVKASASLKSGGVLDLVEGTHYTIAQTNEPAAGGGTVTLNFTRAGMDALAAARTIEVRLQTKILETARISTPLVNSTGLRYEDGNGNVVERDPGVEIDPAVHTGGVRILKVDQTEREKLPLAGAQFKVVLKSSTSFEADLAAHGFVQRNGADYLITTNAQGRADIVGLPYGGQTNHETGFSDYWLIEVTAPTGYVLRKQPMTIRIDATSFEGATAKYMITNAKVPSTIVPPVVGGPTLTLPRTGDVISIISILTLLAVGIALIRRGRKDKERGCSA